MPSRTFVIHGKKSKDQHQSEFRKGWFHPLWITLRGQDFSQEVPKDVAEITRELELETERIKIWSF